MLEGPVAPASLNPLVTHSKTLYFHVALCHALQTTLPGASEKALIMALRASINIPSFPFISDAHERALLICSAFRRRGATHIGNCCRKCKHVGDSVGLVCPGMHGGVELCACMHCMRNRNNKSDAPKSGRLTFETV